MATYGRTYRIYVSVKADPMLHRDESSRTMEQQFTVPEGNEVGPGFASPIETWIEDNIEALDTILTTPDEELGTPP